MAQDRRSLLKGAAAAALVPAALAGLPGRARAQANTLKIGVLNDQSGTYRDLSGPGSVQAVRQAVAEMAGKGIQVEVVVADHQNKPDVGATIARQWFDRDGVDAVIDVPTSSVALAVAAIAEEKNKVFINSGAGTADLTGSQCNANTIHWTYDTWMLAHSTGAAMVKAGGDSWFFITADYAFGHALERDTGEFVKAQGGQLLGSIRTPFPGTTDFSSFLVQAQRSRAKVIGLANAGADTINCVKQAAEFGITRRGTKLAGLLVFISDVHALGLKTAQGLVLTETFYWDMNDRTRALTQRIGDIDGGRKPTMVQAGCYAGTLHYLKAALAMGAADARKSGADVIARMKAMPTDDDAFGQGSIRADGRKIHPAYLFEVKSPEESKGPWDYYKLLQTTAAEEAFRPVAAGGCRLTRT
ncbi:ABC transporter substrate-binding protein [Roseomonas sp. 18066]|uniref:ABC transporter substrate-binding protein n=1 Tax=Roseomonas sp. 18066 TaxID=2681412 RepID=UPI001359ADEB|nr:ABC transporter substrate-binding protein [Roseomonas sp. 18066]